MRPSGPLLFRAALTGALTALSLPALAEGTPLPADLLEPKAIKLDGVPKEWAALTSLSHPVKGQVKKPDLEAKGSLAYDATSLFVTADVTDDTLRAGADHVELTLGFPDGATTTLLLYPGDPGKTPGFARTKDGALAGAKVIEAPRSGGWSLEASIPWSSIPEARLVRVGLRGALFVHDADSSTAVEAIVGTAPSAAYGSLPPINTETEQSLADGLLKEKALRGAPRWSFTADVAGDAMKERVLVYDRYLVVLGPSFRKGSEYFFADLGVDAALLPAFEVRDLTGDGQAEILLRKRFGSATKYREVLQVLRFGTGDVPLPILQHEVGVAADGGSIVNDVSIAEGPGKPTIKITPGKAAGFTQATYNEPVETSFDPVLLPWGPVSSQTYRFDGKQLTKVGEEKQAGAASTSSPSPATPGEAPSKPAPGPGAAEKLEKIYDLYKRDRGAAGKARFDLAVDVGEDAQIERVLVHDRDLVIFGNGWKGGAGYTFLTLAQFAAPADLLDLSARDVTGDGKAEVVVKGVLRGTLSTAGSPVDREVVLIFQVAGGALKRIFAAETARTMGKKRIDGVLRFLGTDLELASGKATEWTEATYPFPQDSSAMFGYEPLLLPWSGSRPARYRWTGSGFAK